jgi:hypothetical protein
VLHKDWKQLLLRYERSVVKEVCRKRQATDKKVVCRDLSTNNFLSVACLKSLAEMAILRMSCADVQTFRPLISIQGLDMSVA